MASTQTDLPAVLNDRLHGLVRRIRLARWLRGTSYLILTLVLFFAGTYLADHLVGLDNFGLRVAFLVLALWAWTERKHALTGIALALATLDEGVPKLGRGMLDARLEYHVYEARVMGVRD